MAMFNRLRTMGEERFGKVLNMLMRGETATSVARTLQGGPPDGWGLFQGVAEKTLKMQLIRLRLQAAEGAFGPEIAQQIAAGFTPQLKILENVSVPVIARLEEASVIQRGRILRLMEKEKKFNSVMPLMDDVMEGYRKLLIDIQKIRFDLGLDEFKGPVGGMMAMRGASQTTTQPDGTSLHKQVFETITTVNQIFDARKIARVVPRNQ